MGYEIGAKILNINKKLIESSIFPLVSFVITGEPKAVGVIW